MCSVQSEAVARGNGEEVPLDCVEADQVYLANGILEAGELGLASVHVTLGEGECPSDGLAEATTDPNGIYVFSDLSNETYCVTINPLNPVNLALLVAGSWTYPNVDGAFTVTLTAGESKLDANFGWDFQFTP